MKVFIIAAITADGFIGVDSAHLATTWTTKADKRFFSATTKDAGVTVFGRNTFETFNRALNDRRTIVLTTQPASISTPGVEATSESPLALVQRLKQEGAPALAVCGGSSVYAQFLEANLVDELYVTVHPVLFGKGVTLLNNDFRRGLRLLDVDDIGDETVMLHYQIVS